MAFTIKGGKFSTTDDDKTIRQSPVDEVIDILTAPSRPAPVNVGMMPERRGNVNIPMGQSTFVNVPGRPDEKQVKTPLKVVSPFTTALNLDPDMFDQDTGDMINYPVGGGRGGPFDGGNFLTSIPFNLAAKKAAAENFRQQELKRMQGTPSLGISSIGAQAQAQGLGAINPYEQFGDTLLGGDASTILGVNAFDKRAAELLGYDMETMEGVTKYLNDTKRSMENQERDQRLDDERRERAAMLAAQQQQPIDPCPEGYRLDPVSKVCVPVDDTTEPDNIAPRTYDTMTRPEPNYTAATNFTVPTVTLPDIFS